LLKDLHFFREFSVSSIYGW